MTEQMAHTRLNYAGDANCETSPCIIFIGRLTTPASARFDSNVLRSDSVRATSNPCVETASEFSRRQCTRALIHGFSACIPHRSRDSSADGAGAFLDPLSHQLLLAGLIGFGALSLGATLSLTPGEAPFVNSTPAASKARLRAETVK